MKVRLPLIAAAILASAGALNYAADTNAQTVPNVWVTGLECNTNPEVTKLTNLGPETVVLVGFVLRSHSDGGTQVYPLDEYSIASGGTLTLLSDNQAADNLAENVHRLTGLPLYRNSDPTDWVVLQDPNGTAQQWNCGQTPSVPTATPVPATATSTTVPATATSTVTTIPSATATAVPPTATATDTAPPTATPTLAPPTATNTAQPTAVPATPSRVVPGPPNTGSGATQDSSAVSLGLMATAGLLLAVSASLALLRRKH